MDERKDKKIGHGTVSPRGDTTGGLSDKQRVHEGALAEAAAARDPTSYPSAEAEEAQWAKDQLNKGPGSDYVGHNRRREDLPDDVVVKAPEGSVTRRDGRRDDDSG